MKHQTWKLIRGAFFSLFTLSLLASPLLSADDVPNDVDERIHLQEGVLDNGVHYLLSQDDDNQNEFSIEVFLPTGTEWETNETLGFNALITRAMFHGTENFDRDEILDILDSIDADVHPESIATVSTEKTLLRFIVPKEQYKHLPLTIQLASELSFHATLTDEAIEIERKALLSSLEKGENNEETIQLIRNVLPETVRAFYREWYQPNRFADNKFNFVLVHLSGHLPSLIAEELIQLSFSPDTAPTITPSTSFDQFTPSFLPNVSIDDDHLQDIIDQIQNDGTENITINGKEYVLIDGKILMKQPAAYQTQSFGFWVGGVAFLCSIVGIVLAATGVFSPLAGVPVALLSALIGSVLIGKGYLNDPDYIKKARVKDLAAGSFTQVYSNDHYRYTLTPMEARQLFIREHYYQPDIKTMSSKYDLYSPRLTKLFTDQEIDLLRYAVNEYRQGMNDLTHIRDQIEYVLEKYLKEARANRDLQLSEVQLAYDSNYFVVREKQVRSERDQAIQNYKNDHKAAVEDITVNGESYGLPPEEIEKEVKRLEEELEANIADVNAWYDSQITGEIVAGLEQAKAILRQSQDRIQQDYKQEEERIKRELGYNAALSEYKAQVEALTNTCNLMLQDILAEFNLEEPSVEDFLISPSVNPKDLL